MSGTYPAYFEDGPLEGQVLEMMRETNGGPSALIVTHHAPSLDLDREAGGSVPDRVVYYLDRRGKVAGGGPNDGLVLFIYREGANDLPEDEHPEHLEPTA